MLELFLNQENITVIVSGLLFILTVIGTGVKLAYFKITKTEPDDQPEKPKSEVMADETRQKLREFHKRLDSLAEQIRSLQYSQDKESHSLKLQLTDIYDILISADRKLSKIYKDTKEED